MIKLQRMEVGISILHNLLQSGLHFTILDYLVLSCLEFWNMLIQIGTEATNVKVVLLPHRDGSLWC